MLWASLGMSCLISDYTEGNRLFLLETSLPGVIGSRLILNITVPVHVCILSGRHGSIAK